MATDVGLVGAELVGGFRALPTWALLLTFALGRIGCTAADVTCEIARDLEGEEGRLVGGPRDDGRVKSILVTF